MRSAEGGVRDRQEAGDEKTDQAINKKDSKEKQPRKQRRKQPEQPKMSGPRNAECVPGAFSPSDCLFGTCQVMSASRLSQMRMIIKHTKILKLIKLSGKLIRMGE